MVEAKDGVSPFYDRDCGSAAQGGAGRRPGDEVQLLQAVSVINELLRRSRLSAGGAGGSERLDR